MKSPVEWLLEGNQPAVRYSTLTQVIGKPLGDEDVKEAYSEIPRRGWAAKLLEEQLPDFHGLRGYWHNYVLLNRPKYVTTMWKFLVLVDLGLTAKNGQVLKTCELLSERCLKNEQGYHLCTTANVTRALIQAGYDTHDRVRLALDWLVREQKEDGGWHCFESSKGTLDCWEPLSTYAVLPRNRWTRGIKRSAEWGAEFYLERRLTKEGPRRYAPWFRFHYPVHYYYDVLVGLDVLTSLGYGKDSRMKPALDLLRRKCRPDGRWALDALNPDLPADLPASDYSMSPPFEPFPAVPFGLEKVGRPSKMITLRATRVLKRVETAG
ncbi:MAG: hypothetical protein ABSG45_03205 [Nitrososphaerales archaeon]|jgi:hypothetical protein